MKNKCPHFDNLTYDEELAKDLSKSSWCIIYPLILKQNVYNLLRLPENILKSYLKGLKIVYKAQISTFGRELTTDLHKFTFLIGYNEPSSIVLMN